MEREITDRLEEAQKMARAAGALALAHFHDRESLVIGTKADLQDVFSAADREVETLIRDAVTSHFGGDGFLGEEYGLSPGKSGFSWVVDPIDGTSPFIAGISAWCVSISILRDVRTVAGLIYVPVADELFVCREGGGATLNGAPLRLSDTTSLRSGLTGVGANSRVPRETIVGFIDGLLEIGGMFIRNGSGALMLAEVAAGRLAAYYEPHMNSWDCLAGMLMVREAGGWTGPLPDGDALLRGGPVMAAGPGARAELEGLVAGATARGEAA